jgi:hypothetical protein
LDKGGREKARAEVREPRQFHGGLLADCLSLRLDRIVLLLLTLGFIALQLDRGNM